MKKQLGEEVKEGRPKGSGTAEQTVRESHFDPSGCVVADEDSPVFHAYDDAPEDPADDPYVLAFADLAASDIIHRFRHAGHPFDRAGFSGLGFIEG